MFFLVQAGGVVFSHWSKMHVPQWHNKKARLRNETGLFNIMKST